MLSMEGCELFEAGLSTVVEWAEKGVVMGALVWNNPNELAYPGFLPENKGLTAYGLQVAKEMQRLGMAVDVSHLSDAGFYDLMNKTHQPPIASHSCCRKLCSNGRNLTDHMIRALIAGGGYIGVNFYPVFLSDDGTATIETLVNHIDHICQLGGDQIVGFGSDFDGIEVQPEGLADCAALPALLSALKKRGYSEEAIQRIAGENLCAYFERIRGTL